MWYDCITILHDQFRVSVLWCVWPSTLEMKERRVVVMIADYGNQETYDPTSYHICGYENFETDKLTIAAREGYCPPRIIVTPSNHNMALLSLCSHT